MTIEITNSHKDGDAGEYVGRGSALGNPFPITKDASRNQVCDEYEHVFAQWVQNQEPTVMQELTRLRTVYEQTGNLKLRCFCAPQRCHAETIRRWIEANAFDNEENF